MVTRFQWNYIDYELTYNNHSTWKLKDNWKKIECYLLFLAVFGGMMIDGVLVLTDAKSVTK